MPGVFNVSDSNRCDRRTAVKLPIMKPPATSTKDNTYSVDGRCSSSTIT